MVGALHGGLVALQLQVVVFAEEVLVPLDGFFRLVQAVGHDFLGHLAAQAGGADNEALVVLLQVVAVGAGAHILADGPRAGHQLDEVVVAFLVLGQDNKVPAALVLPAFLLVHGAVGHVHLAADDGLEQLRFRLGDFLSASRQLRLGLFVPLRNFFQLGDALLQVLDFPARAAVLLVDIVIKFLDAEHVAVVGDGNALHAVLHGLVHQAADAGLSVQQGILGVYV